MMKNNLIAVICNVYMPFFDPSNHNNTLLSSDIVSRMQWVMDKFSSQCPVFFMGDFNAQLPQLPPSHANWFKCRGFTKHSKILNDFMSDCNLVALDLMNVQSVQHTYFCHSRGVYSWIDHVLCASPHADWVSRCYIAELVSDNDSDHHLPIFLNLSLITPHNRTPTTPQGACSPANTAVHIPSPIYWDDGAKELFKRTLEQKMLQIEMTGPWDELERQSAIDQCMTSVCDAITSAAWEVRGEEDKQRKYKPKPYWCPQLSQLRDKKRFWWRIWQDCGRPREGAVWDSYKAAKREFRRVNRDRVNALMRRPLSKMNEMFYAGRLSAFWRHVKRSRKLKVTSKLTPSRFATHYGNIMADTGQLDQEQSQIASQVDEWAEELSRTQREVTVSSRQVSHAIKRLNSNCAPGMDGVTSEHLKCGITDAVCGVLARLFSLILTWGVVPSSFCTGVIIPILKKPGLDTNDPNNFRPVTLSSAFSKILEIIMLPQDSVCETQFGFRSSRGTQFACVLFNDVRQYFYFKRSPLFTCSLDAEKCFDSIWHSALLYKLYHKIPHEHWLVIYRWYGSLRATIRWNSQYSESFSVTKGTRQGSILSPQLFNIFIDDLLISLRDSQDQVCIGNCKVNSFAYADDITVMSTTSPGLQRLINLCADYAKQWRFRFGIKKTKCMTLFGEKLNVTPKWFLNDQEIELSSCLEILGVDFHSSNSSSSHVEKRMEKCRRSFYSLRDSGMCYPGCASDVKSYMWNAMCQPVLLYGLDCVAISNRNMHGLETCQGNLVKQAIGLSKRSRSTALLEALKIKKINECVKNRTACLLNRIFSVESPVQSLTSHFMSLFLSHNILVPNTLVNRIVAFNLSPVRCAFTKYQSVVFKEESGLIDSLRYLLMCENFIKPYSDEHVLSVLLTKSF